MKRIYYVNVNSVPTSPTYGEVRTLNRWIEEDNGNLLLEKWDSETKSWVDNPALFAASGIGGSNDYMPVPEDEVEMLLTSFGVPGENTEEKETGILESIRSELNGLKQLISNIIRGNKAYNVQPFHRNFELDESGKWAFSASDGNAIIEKGGWPLYKSMHLVVDTSEGSTPEKKDAYLYPVAKLVSGKPTYFLKAAQTVYAGVRGGARGADLPDATNKRVVNTLKKIYSAFGRDTEQMETKESDTEMNENSIVAHIKELLGSGKNNIAFSFKTLNGEQWWFQWTTNAFQDRDGEIFTTKALTDFVERHQDDDVKGEFWYRHIPGSKFGTVKWQAMVGRFLAQAGPFDDTPTGQAFKEFFTQYPDGHPKLAPEGWGASHGYNYDREDRTDGVYEWLEIKESTVLRSDAASNPWNPAPKIIQRSAIMNDKEKKELLEIGGQALVDAVMQQGEEATKNLEGRNIAHKNYAEYADRLMTIAEALEDETAKQELIALATEMAEYGMMEGTEQMEEETVGVEEELGYSEEACATEKLTKELGEALKVVVATLRKEISDSNEASRKAFTEALTPIVEAVGALQESDEKKIAKKVSQTPANSLMEMVTSVIGSKEAEVKDEDEIKGKGPKVTDPQQPRPDGLPSFLANMFDNQE